MKQAKRIFCVGFVSLVCGIVAFYKARGYHDSIEASLISGVFVSVVGIIGAIVYDWFKRDQ